RCQNKTAALLCVRCQGAARNLLPRVQSGRRCGRCVRGWVWLRLLFSRHTAAFYNNFFSFFALYFRHRAVLGAYNRVESTYSCENSETLTRDLQGGGRMRCVCRSVACLSRRRFLCFLSSDDLCGTLARWASKALS